MSEQFWPDEIARSEFDPTHRIWCPCFQAWQPAQADTTTCPAYGCTPDLLLVKEAVDG